MENGVTWPGGAQCAAMFTFDFDAETLWLSRDPSNWKKPGTLSQGLYGAKVGVPKILELLEESGLRATFFVPGWTAEKHTARVEAILSAGHEVGHHGYLHEWPDPDDPEGEETALDRGLEALQKTVGVRPKGYRSPAGLLRNQIMDRSLKIPIGVLSEDTDLVEKAKVLEESVRKRRLFRIHQCRIGPIHPGIKFCYF